MRIAGVQTFIVALLVLFGLGVQDSSAQLFRSKKKKKMTKPAALVRRQAAPKVDERVEPLINQNNSYVRISLSRQRAYVMTGDEVYIDTPVSTGKRAGSTPQGDFTVLEKDADHRSNIYGDFVDRRGRVVRSGVSMRVDSAPSGTRFRGAPMDYFCRLTWSGVGMHVGILPGYPASHGCIRLPKEIAPLIYNKVKVGTPVSVEP